MGHNPGASRTHREMQQAEAIAKAKVVVDRDRAIAAVSSWNIDVYTGRVPALYPTIGGAVAAGTPWLSFMCPGCQQVGEVDLRTFDRHARAPISSLIPKLSCSRCCGNAPFAKLLELRERRGEFVSTVNQRT